MTALALILAAYAASWLLASPVAARLYATRPKCHGEGGYTWPRRHLCKRHCRSDTCWRPGEVNLKACAIGLLIAAVWPATLPLAWTAWAATRTPLAARMSADEMRAEIARMERENGIAS
jgi:hypothetical protein